MACAQQLHQIASEQLLKADQSSDPSTQQFYMAAARAYSEWALGMEQVTQAIEGIERSTLAAADRIPSRIEECPADVREDVAGPVEAL